MGERIKLTASDDSGEFGAYLSPLPAKPGPGIVMLHEILGITPWIEEIADQFAARGYCVAAPDMFWRLEPNFVADYRIPEQRAKHTNTQPLIQKDRTQSPRSAWTNNPGIISLSLSSLSHLSHHLSSLSNQVLEAFPEYRSRASVLPGAPRELPAKWMRAICIR